VGHFLSRLAGKLIGKYVPHANGKYYIGRDLRGVHVTPTYDLTS